jgi:cytochrome c2
LSYLNAATVRGCEHFLARMNQAGNYEMRNGTAPARGSRRIVGFTGLLVVLAACTTIATDGQGDAERGRKITEKWCVLCHAVAGAKAPTAPAFADVVRRPGRDETYLRRFLNDDHFPMTMFRLRDDERDDVIAYFRTLKNRQ